jgi:hypothetical protein
MANSFENPEGTVITIPGGSGNFLLNHPNLLVELRFQGLATLLKRAGLSRFRRKVPGTASLTVWK